MNREKFRAICTRAIIAAATTSGIFALGTQTASAQAITATVPFAFSAGNQPFPAGTYQFTFLSEWSSPFGMCKAEARNSSRYIPAE